MRGSPCRVCQQGGALVECTLVCTLMVPVFMWLITVGNIIDIKQTTIQASRYVAWEQTVSPGFRTSSDIKARFYEQVDERLVSFEAGAGHHLDSNIGSNGVATSFGKSIHKAGKVLDFLDNVDWSLEADGLLDTGVQVNIVNNKLPGAGGRACNGKQVAGLFGCVSAHNTIMVDGWGVASNDLAERRSRALVPGAMLAKTGNALSRLGKIPFLKEFKGLKNAFGSVDSTVLPLDRYTGTYTEAFQ